jgi:RNA polymerase sigma factor (sigma-70 family)
MSQSDDPPRARPAVPPWSRNQWDQFLNSHTRPLRAVIARRAKLQPHDQDEAFAETLVGVAAVIAAGEQPNAPFSFVAGVAVNKTRSKVRQLAVARRRFCQQLSGGFEDPARHGFAALEAGDRHGAVRDYLARLDPTDRDILVSRSVHDLTWDQVSARVGLPKTTVVRRYAAAVQQARHHLAAWAP